MGSVTRTLQRGHRPRGGLRYQQVKAVYISAFIDTAIGKSLDLVVSILGVTRKTKDFAEGLVTFFRIRRPATATSPSRRARGW